MQTECKQNVLNEKLLCAIQHRKPVQVFACLVDGAQVITSQLSSQYVVKHVLHRSRGGGRGAENATEQQGSLD